MADKKKGLSAVVADQAAEAAPTTTRTRPAARTKPVPAGRSARQKLTVDLDIQRYDDLAQASLDLGVSKVEIIRALLDVFHADPKIQAAVNQRLPAVHRPKGYAATSNAT